MIFTTWYAYDEPNPLPIEVNPATVFYVGHGHAGEFGPYTIIQSTGQAGICVRESVETVKAALGWAK